MANDSFDLDDFDFDDDLNFDIPDFDGGGENDDRKPTTKLAAGFKEGIKDELTNPKQLERIARLSLPPGYSLALNAKDTALSSAKELYNTAAEELKPLTGLVKGAVGKISPKTKEKLPRWLQNKIDNLGQGDDGYQSEEARKEEAENSEITSAIGEIFKTQLEAQQEQRSQDRAEEMVKTQIETKQRNDLLSNAQVIAKGIDRMVGYQDSILSKYHQKSLELQFRHYFATRDLLSVTNVAQEKMIGALESVVKNTALPEAVKIQKHEMAGMLLKQRMAEAGLNSIANFTRDFRERMMGNLTNMVKGALGHVDSVAGMLDNGMPGDKMVNSGSLLGSLVFDEATQWGANKLKPILGKNKHIAKGNLAMRELFTAIPERMMRYARSETKGTGIGSFFTQMFKDAIPRYGLNDSVGGKGMMEMDQPAIFDNLTRKSIIEVIPTYLSHIAHWTKATATGKVDDDMQVYNLQRGTLTGSKSVLNDMKRFVSDRQENINAKSELDAFIDKTLNGKPISDEARAAFRRRLLRDTQSGIDFSPEDYAQRQSWTGVSEEVQNELIQFFTDEFDLDPDGKFHTSQTTENRTKIVDLKAQASKLKDYMPGIDDRIRAVVDVFGKDSLRKMGLIRRVGREDVIDREALDNLILNERALTDEEMDLKSRWANRNQALPGESRTEHMMRIQALNKERAGARFMDDEDDVDDEVTASQASATGGKRGLFSRDDGISGKMRAVLKEMENMRDTKKAARGANISDSALNKYLSFQSPVHAELVAIKEAILSGTGNFAEYRQENSQLLMAIRDVLTSANFGAGAGAPDSIRQKIGEKMSGFFGRFDRGVFKGISGSAKGLVKGAGGYIKGMGSLYKKLGTGSFKLAGFALPKMATLTGWVGKKLTETKTNAKRLRENLLTKLETNKLKAKEYFDVQSGKWIERWEDITGEVRDKAGNIIITAKEYAEGLRDSKGKPLWLKMSSFAGQFAKDVTTSPFRAVGGLLGNVGGGIATQWRKLKDGYLVGEKSPRIVANIMRDGGYLDQATGKVIKSYKDIKGTVTDRWGRVVVTAEELKAAGGLRALNKERLTTITDKIFGAGGNMVGSLFDAAAGAARMLTAPMRIGGAIASRMSRSIGNFIKRGFGIETVRLTGNFGEDGITLLHSQLAVQTQILKYLDPKAKVKKTRIGSWMEQRNRKKDDKVTTVGPDGKKRNWSIMGFLTNLLPMAITGITGLIGTIGTGFAAIKGFLMALAGGKAAASAAGTIKDIFSNSDVPDLDRDGKNKKKGKKLKSPKFNNQAAKNAKKAAAEAAKKAGKKGLVRGAGSALGHGARFVGGKLLMRGAGAVLGGAATVLGAPAIGTMLAAAGVAYTAYEVYQWFTRKPDPLTCIRMAQYGVDPEDTGLVNKMVKLEAMVEKETHWSAKGTRIAGSKVDLKDALDIFDINLEDKSEESELRMRNWLQWYENRFRPTFEHHATVYHSITGERTLKKLDKMIPKEKASDYIDRVKTLTGPHDFTDLTSPLEDEPLTQGPEQIAKWVKEAYAEFKDKEKPQQKGTVSADGKTGIQGNKVITESQSVLDPSGRTFNLKEETTLQGWKKWTAKGLDVALGTVTLGFGSSWGTSAMNWLLGDKDSYSKLSVGQLVRIKAYGLGVLEQSRIRALMQLELEVLKLVTYQQGMATFKGSDVTMLDRFAGTFELISPESKSKWLAWFNTRFIPVFLSYCTAVKAQGDIEVYQAESKLSNEKLKAVLMAVIEAQGIVDGKSISVWSIPLSPWADSVATSTRESALANIDSIGTDTKDKKITDPAEKSLYERSKEGLANAWDKAKDIAGTAKDKLKSGWDWLKSTASAGMDMVKSAAQTANDMTGGRLGMAANAVGAVGAGVISGAGQAIRAVGRGVGGLIDQIPDAAGSGWAAVKDTIVGAAKMVGFDPAIAATIAAVESAFRPGIKAATSSASGLFQFIDSTWKTMLQKYGAKYGIDPGTPQTDARASSLMGMEYLKENADALKGIGRPVTETDLYLAHFLGPAGAKRFLKAPSNDPAIKHVTPGAAKANQSIFYTSSGVPRTVAQVYELFAQKLAKGARQHDLTAGTGADVAVTESTSATVDGGSVTSVVTSGNVRPEDSNDPEVQDLLVKSRNGSNSAVDKAMYRAQAAKLALKKAGAADAQSSQVTDVASAAPAVSSDLVAAAGNQRHREAVEKQLAVNNDAMNENLSAVVDETGKSVSVQTSMDARLAQLVELIGQFVGKEKDRDVAKAASPDELYLPNRPASERQVPVAMSRNRA